MSANATSPQPTSLESRVLEIVRQLLDDLGSQRALRSLSLQSSLERELGLGSLERVELLDRLEKEFGRRFSEQLLTEAERPSDLVAALVSESGSLASQGGVATTVLARQARDAVAQAKPASERQFAQLSNIETLAHALLHHARCNPSQDHVYLYGDDPSPHTITYDRLCQEALRVSRGLVEQGLRQGETVALMLPTGEEFFFAFFGVLLAGGVPVPTYPPFKASRLEEYAQRQSRILRNAEARFLVTFRQAEKLGKLLKPGIPSLKAVVTMPHLSSATTSSEPQRLTEGIHEGMQRLPGRNAAALIQYTSGSTGDPKGVVLTHSNLIANIRAIGEGLQIQPTDVAASWLPLYHDMGLIGSWLAALYFGVPIAILSPVSFLSRPERWLWMVHHHRATLSAAPNFAYELCARKIDERALDGLDLSCWRAALNGAEPVSPDTMERFTRRFQPYGFRPEALLPVYGLAESSVGLTFPPLGRKSRVDQIERERFERSGEARPCAVPESALQFVSTGRALPGHAVQVVDDGNREVGERIQGRIQFRGPSTMQGYFRNPEATAAVVRDGWVETGDLGYMADGELFVTARVKDVIIKGGRNLYPQEVEEAAAEVEGVRRGCVAAFGVSDKGLGTEKLVIVAETRQTDKAARDHIASQIVAQVDGQLGLPPDIVLLVLPQTVPKTSSGKIRRDACKRMYLEGKLAAKPLPVWMQLGKLATASGISRLQSVALQLSSIVYGIYAWFAFLVVMLPGWLPVLLLPRRRVPATFRFLCRAALRLAGLSPQVEGEALLAEAASSLRGKALLVASNHASYLDVLVVTAACPFSVCFVSKSEAATWPVVGTFIRKCGFLTVSRENASHAAADSEGISSRLKSGDCVHVFPEGTFTPQSGLRPFQMGVFKAAVETGCPILPLTLRGTREVLRDGTSLPRYGRVKVVASPLLRPKARDWREMVRLRDVLRTEILKHCGEGTFDAVLAGAPK